MASCAVVMRSRDRVCRPALCALSRVPRPVPCRHMRGGTAPGRGAEAPLTLPGTQCRRREKRLSEMPSPSRMRNMPSAASQVKGSCRMSMEVITATTGTM